MISKAARRYSIALYSLAQERLVVNELANDFTYCLELIHANRDLELFFHNPSINKRKKFIVIKEIFEGKVGALALNFLNLLVTRGRESLTKDIMIDFLNLKKEKDGIIDVKVTTSFEMNEEEKSALSRKIESRTGKKSDTKYHIDKSLIGGFVAKIGDTVLDASVKRQLELLREQFRSGDYSLN
jgi:F-type H+-transporting ATPase subunit delta